MLQQGLQAIAAATGDAYRLVRVRAARALAGYPGLKVSGDFADKINKANAEFMASLVTRPDQWSSHYNIGNYHLSRNELKDAVASYAKALEFEPRAVMAMVNSSIAYAQMGQNDRANESLQAALKAAPDNAEANFNMGLLRAEQNDLKEAERYLRTALRLDPQMAPAAYNLCILTSKERLEEAIGFGRRASQLRPDEPKYAFTLAYYLNQKGDSDEALRTLNSILEMFPAYQDAQALRDEIAAKKRNP